MDCDVVRAELHDYFDGELIEDEHRAIKKHLQHCNLCYYHAFLLHTTLNLLRHLPTSQPDQAYWDVVTERVMERIPLKKSRV